MNGLGHLINDGQPRCIHCPYCEQPLDGPIKDGMHAECNEQFGRDLDEIYPDEHYLQATPDIDLEEPEDAEELVDDILVILERF